MIDDALNMSELRLETKHIQCFPAGTLVHTDKGLVPIQNIKVGDMVLSRPEWGGKDAPTEYKRVTRAFCSGEDELIRLSCQRDSEYDVWDAPIYIEFMTPNHPIWVESLKEWIPASDLEIGTLLSSIDNLDNLRILSIEPVYKSYKDENIVVGCCHELSYGGEQQLLDMLIQFDKDNLLIEKNYMSNYEISESNRIKYDLEVSEKFFDNYKNNRVWDRELKVPVYNIEVEENHTYFIGRNGIWVHNTNCTANVSGTIN